jgi:hypothetical protein
MFRIGVKRDASVLVKAVGSVHQPAARHWDTQDAQPFIGLYRFPVEKLWFFVARRRSSHATSDFAFRFEWLTDHSHNKARAWPNANTEHAM